METLNKSANREVAGFIDQWKNHPVSIPIIVLLVTSAFMFLIVQREINSYTILIAGIFCGFSFALLLVVVVVLIKLKFVFYNATELVITEGQRQLSTLQESLSDVEIGYGMAFERLRAPAISNEIHNSIQHFELLSSLLKRIGYRLNVNDSTKKALTKYYLRNKKYRKALAWIDQVADKKDSEYNFLNGLILWRLDKGKESRMAFDQSTHSNAEYYKLLTYLTNERATLEELQLFVREVKNETGQVFTNFFAQLNISTAYTKMALIFPKNGQLVDPDMLRSALENAERLLPRDTTGFAYFNAACYISLMGHYKVDISPEQKFDEQIYCDKIIDNLRQAIELNAISVKYAANDEDLKWARTVSGDNFAALIGRNCRRCSSL